MSAKPTSSTMGFYARLLKALSSIKMLKIASLLISASILWQSMNASTAVSPSPTMMPSITGGSGFYTPYRGFYLTQVDYWHYSNSIIKGF